MESGTMIPVRFIQAVCVYCYLFGRCVYGLADEDAYSCHSDSFPCSRDCCRKGEWFCNEKEQRCSECETIQEWCGNESYVPVGCLLYCFKILQTPFNTTTSCATSFNYWTFIAASVFSAMLMLLIIAVIVICTLRGRPLRAWPSCVRAILAIRFEHGDAEMVKNQVDGSDDKLQGDISRASSNDCIIRVPLLRPNESSVTLPRHALSESWKSETVVPVKDVALNVTSTPIIPDDGSERVSPPFPADGNTQEQSQAAYRIAKLPTKTAQNFHQDGFEMDKNVSPVTEDAINQTKSSPRPTDAGYTARVSDIPGAEQCLPPRNQSIPSASAHADDSIDLLSRPHFSHMNPTNDGPKGHQNIVITTGTENPAKNCQEHKL